MANESKDSTSWFLFYEAVSNFIKTFFASAAIGVASGLISALVGLAFLQVDRLYVAILWEID